MGLSRTDVENKALDVLEEMDIENPVVNAVDIARRNGLQVKEIEMPREFQDVAGFYSEKGKTIYVARDDHPVKKLFTVAHELGHVFLGHKNYDVLFRIPNENGAYREQEREANMFAAELLMPDFMLREYLKKYVLAPKDYKQMADIFGVPHSSMRHQLEHLKP